MIGAAAQAIIDHADELTALDQAIGDGDHGFNMKRGFTEVLAQLDSIAAKPPGEALKAVGMALVMKVGGASGPSTEASSSAWERRLATALRAWTSFRKFSPRASKPSLRGASRGPAKRRCSMCSRPCANTLQAGGPDLVGELREVAAASRRGNDPDARDAKAAPPFSASEASAISIPALRSSQILVEALLPFLEDRS